MRAALAVLVLAGCGGMKADVSGSISGTSVDEIKTIYHGGPFLLLFTDEVDCIDADWVARAYNDGIAPTDLEFTAVQFNTDDDAFIPGTFSLEGNSAVTSWGLVNGAEFESHRARAGTLTIDGVDDKDRWIQGSFSTEFADGTVAGSFTSEYCRNMDP